jgi:hypothetical protein
MSPKDAMAPIGVKAKTAERRHATKSRLISFLQKVQKTCPSFDWFNSFNWFGLSQPIQPMKQIKRI